MASQLFFQLTLIDEYIIDIHDCGSVTLLAISSNTLEGTSCVLLQDKLLIFCSQMDRSGGGGNFRWPDRNINLMRKTHCENS